MSNTAPIVIFAFNRLNQTREVIEHLAKNKLAGESDLYIFSDGPKDNPESVKKVNELRAYLKTVKGFRSHTVIEREKNMGLAKSVIAGVTEVINKHGKIIVLEDDLLTSPNFLEYSNQALDFYQHDKRVFSISGYQYPVSTTPSKDYDVHFLHRASSYGWSSWADRWQHFVETPDRELIFKNRHFRKFFCRGGEDLYPMLIKQQFGKIDSWAIRWTLTHYLHQGICVFPYKTKIHTLVPEDNSGTHVKKTFYKNLNSELDEGKNFTFRFNPAVQPDPEAERAVYNYSKPSIIRRTINFIKFGIR